MFKRLVQWFGGSSRFYENLMNSRKELSSFTESDVVELKELLTNLQLEARFYASSSINEQCKSDLSYIESTDFTLQFAFQHKSFHFLYSCYPEKAIKKDKFHELRILKNGDQEKASFLGEGKLKISLPIWEELVHRAKPINEFVKTKAPQNPWTLYKTAKSKVVPSEDYKIQIGGYPQWLINNIDFRKIKKLEFIMEFKLSDNCSIYYFMDPENNEIQYFKQLF